MQTVLLVMGLIVLSVIGVLLYQHFKFINDKRKVQERAIERTIEGLKDLTKF